MRIWAVLAMVLLAACDAGTGGSPDIRGWEAAPDRPPPPRPARTAPAAGADIAGPVADAQAEQMAPADEAPAKPRRLVRRAPADAEAEAIAAAVGAALAPQDAPATVATEPAEPGEPGDPADPADPGEPVDPAAAETAETAAGSDPGAPDMPPAEEPAPEAAPVVKSKAQLACERKDGSWQPWGTEGGMVCFTRPRDAGKSCDAATDCSTTCLARSRTCAPLTPLFGCNDVLTRYGQTVTECTE